MSYAKYETISVDEILGAVKDTLRLNSTKDDAGLRRDIRRAIKDIRAYDTIEPQKACDLQFHDGKVEVPCNFVAFPASKFPLKTFNAGGCCYPTYWDETIMYRGTEFAPAALTFQMQNNCIVLSSKDYEGLGELNFLGTLVDEHGRPIIFNRYFRPIEAYALWRYGIKYSDEPRFTSEWRQTHHQLWANGAKELVGDANIDYGPQTIRVDYVMNTLFP